MSITASMPRARQPEPIAPDRTGCAGPIIFDPMVRADRRALRRVRSSGRVTRTIDLLPRQLAELARIGSGEPGCPGCWVFFPWSGHLVRMVPGELWRLLRSDRNRYKVTSAEQQRLQQATIAVAGLSAGAAVVQVLALEGTGGRLRLADPDVLDGSNCNRVRASLWDLGQPKAVLAARMVWELDPFRCVDVVHEPVGPANVAAFLDGVDVVIEECDSFGAKVLIRQEARRRRLPVVMATSEGGMLDVERFDVEPARPLFHGVAPELETADLAAVSPDERVRLALSVIGPEHLSDRSAATMIELDRTVWSWPQLAGELVAGGAHAAVAVRRMVLGLPCPSGRYHVDIDRVLAAGPRVPAASCPPPAPRAVAIPGRVRSDRRGTHRFVEDVVRAATTAPSGGNSQPWRFEWDGRHLRVRLDRGRARTALDPRGAGGWVALGAACENIAIASGRWGRPAHFTWFPDDTDDDLAATVSFPPTGGEPASDCVRLFPLVHRRCTDRSAGAASALSPTEKHALHAAAAVHGAELHLVEDRVRIEQFAALIGVSDRVRFLNPALHRQLTAELRWTERASRATGDGVDVASLGLPPGGVEVLRLLARPGVSSFLARHDLGSRLAELQRRTLSATSALAVVAVQGDTSRDRLRGGRAVQRVWLEATANRLAVHPVTPLTLGQHLEDPDSCLSDADRRRLGAAPGLCSLLGRRDAVPVLILRLHRGSGVVPGRARRRAVHEVLTTTQEMT